MEFVIILRMVMVVIVKKAIIIGSTVIVGIITGYIAKIEGVIV